MHGPVLGMVHRPDTVIIQIGNAAKLPDRRALISKFPVRQSQSRKIKVATMARTRQTVNVSKLEKIPPEELAKWPPIQRRLYWEGFFYRRRAEAAQLKVFVEEKILYGIFTAGKILENRR